MKHRLTILFECITCSSFRRSARKNSRNGYSFTVPSFVTVSILMTSRVQNTCSGTICDYIRMNASKSARCESNYKAACRCTYFSLFLCTRYACRWGSVPEQRTEARGRAGEIEGESGNEIEVGSEGEVAGRWRERERKIERERVRYERE